MLPLLFGTSKRRLFGMYQPPTGAADRQQGVLLCYPSVQEYMRAHFAFRKLAGLLTQEGFHVLRFDYYGTGDSAGDMSTATLDEWCANIEQAADELRDQSGVRSVSVVGLRLGATLAALTASAGMDVRDLVLWEPAMYGRAHLDDLQRIQQRMLALLRLQVGRPLRTRPDELLGYPLPPRLAEALARVDLRALPPSRAEGIFLFAAQDRPEYRALAEVLRGRRGSPPEYHVVPDETNARANTALLSTNILRQMTMALARRRA